MNQSDPVLASRILDPEESPGHHIVDMELDGGASGDEDDDEEEVSVIQNEQSQEGRDRVASPGAVPDNQGGDKCSNNNAGQ